jgi:hypothetical protein
MAARLGQGGAVAAAVVVVLALVVWRVGRRRHRTDQSATPADTGVPAGQTVAHGTCTAG